MSIANQFRWYNHTSFFLEHFSQSLFLESPVKVATFSVSDLPEVMTQNKTKYDSLFWRLLSELCFKIVQQIECKTLCMKRGHNANDSGVVKFIQQSSCNRNFALARFLHLRGIIISVILIKLILIKYQIKWVCTYDASRSTETLCKKT